MLHRTATTTGPTQSKKRGTLLFVLLIAQLMVILDITAVNIALPSIAGDLELTGSSISWTITSYSLIFGSLLLFGGRAADLLGRRRMFLTGLGIFTVVLVRLGDGRHGRRPLRRSGRPGSRRSDALPRSTRDHHVRLPGQAAREGARCLGRSRRRRCCDRRARRRRPDRVRRLADDLLRQPPRRRRTRDRRTEDHPGRHPEAPLEGSRPSRRRARNRRASARSSSRSRRPRVRAGPPPRRTCSASVASPASPASRPSSAAPTRRCCGSSGWPIAPSAAASS